MRFRHAAMRAVLTLFVVAACSSGPAATAPQTAVPTVAGPTSAMTPVPTKSPTQVAATPTAIAATPTAETSPTVAATPTAAPTSTPTTVAATDTPTAGALGRAVSLSIPVYAGAYACAVFDSGSIGCWGSTPWSDFRVDTPQQIPGLAGATAVTTAPEASCALIEGTIWCWGSGALGDGNPDTQPASDQPVQVIGITTATSVSAGPDMTCASLQDGTAWCWGDGGAPMGLGSPDVEESAVPVQVQGLSNAVLVRATGAGACAVTADGEVYCWGVARGSFLCYRNDQCSAARFEGVSDVVDLALDQGQVCALHIGGSVSCWWVRNVESGEPLEVAGVAGAAMLFGPDGNDHTFCAADTQASFSCWVPADTGSVAPGSPGEPPVAVPQASLAGATAFAIGLYTCAVMDGAIACSDWDWVDDVFPSPETVYQP